jgi:hypothetical protein
VNVVNVTTKESPHEVVHLSPVPAFHTGKKEKLWQEFFSDPSQWWDHRSDKVTEYACFQNAFIYG